MLLFLLMLNFDRNFSDFLSEVKSFEGLSSIQDSKDHIFPSSIALTIFSIGVGYSNFIRVVQVFQISAVCSRPHFAKFLLFSWKKSQFRCYGLSGDVPEGCVGLA